MRFLRTASTRTLVAATLALATAIVAGSALAIAASGGGPVPPAESLAQAVHGALAAPAVSGISARVTFTNHLIDASDIHGADPLLQGASGRLWLSPAAHRLRLELQSDGGDAQVVVDNRSFWVYDPASNTVYEGSLPAHATAGESAPSGGGRTGAGTLSVAKIQSELNALARHLDLSGAIPGDLAGRPAYTVRVSPKHDGGLLGDVQLAWDALRGVPLRFAVYARGDSTPVLELTVGDISYGPVAASVFAISPPRGAKTVKVSTAALSAAARSRSGTAAHRPERPIVGVAAVARRLGFPLVAPKTLVGLPRQSVTLLDWAGRPAALVTYGQNLGGIAVIEQSASSAGSLTAGGGHQGGLSLPSVSIDGASGQELDTALGTLIRFTRERTTYTVLGSVPPVAAEAAARAL